MRIAITNIITIMYKENNEFIIMCLDKNNLLLIRRNKDSNKLY